MITENEIPKYLKSTESNISKSNRKSKHKHQYKECLIQYPFTFLGNSRINTGLYSYCSICGRINTKLKEDQSIVKNYRRKSTDTICGKAYSYIISGDKLYEKYHDKLPVFFVENIFKDKCVDLEHNCNSERE